MIRPVAGLAALFVLTAGPAAAQRNCEFQEPREARLQVSSADRLLLIARAGSLRVEGRDGLSEVRVQGTACASSRDILELLRVRAEHSTGTARVEVEEVDYDSWDRDDDRYAYLHLVVEVPRGMTVDIEDGSGEMIVRGTGALTIEDGSGEIEIEDISGDVRIDDGSGEVLVARVRGDVDVDDGSGEVSVRDITGSVRIDDGSGSIDVVGVEGSVRIPDDGSGSVDVRNVGGDLIVDDDKRTGDVRYSDVRGRVEVPVDERERRRRRRG